MNKAIDKEVDRGQKMMCGGREYPRQASAKFREFRELPAKIWTTYKI